MSVEELIAKEEVLLSEWEEDCPGMVKDGLVDAEFYLNSKYKILFLLKEVNGGKDWDLRGFLRAGGRKQTWNNVARWTKGINNIEKEISWKELEDISDNERIELLRYIAVVNLKKTSGSHTSIAEEINTAAKRNANRLKDQISLYAPNIIICGGTEGQYFGEIAGYKPEWKCTSRGIWYVVEDEKRIVISYSHPEARVKDCLLYYGIVDAVREILHKELH